MPDPRVECLTRIRHTVLSPLIATLVLSTATDAAAVCVPCDEWSYSNSPQGTPTTPTYANGLVALAIDGTVYLRRPGDGSAAGKYSSGSDIRRSPALVELPDPAPGHWYVFAALTSGYIFKLDVPDPVPNSGTATLEVATTANVPQYRSMLRGACAADTLLAEPVVQRRADSNVQFTLDKDIVMVATAHACGDTTQNQIVALDAADVTQAPLWVFNSGEYEIGRIRVCLLDLERNRLDCVAEHPEASYQAGVFSLDTNTGSLMWGAIYDAGAHARPALGAPGGPGAGHLYVGDELSRVSSFDAVDGTPHGSLTLVSVSDGVTPDIDADLTVGTGIYAGLVLAVSSNGRIAALYDDGTDLLTAWESNTDHRVVSQAVPVESLGKLYAGTSDGYFHQLDLGSGSDEARGIIRFVPVTPVTIENLVIGVYLGLDGLHHMVGTVNAPGEFESTTQYRVPCEYASLTCVPFYSFINGFE